MQLTLHVTKACNLRCRYCYYEHFPAGSMTPEVALQAATLALDRRPEPLAVTWFGGEPLLKKPLIRELTPKIRALAASRSQTATFKIPTNGHLLDADFLAFCEVNAIFISLSIDGAEQANADRVDPAGDHPWARSLAALQLLARHATSFATYSVVTPANVDQLHASVRFLHEHGARLIIVALDYDAEWDESALAHLGTQYRELASFWSGEMRAGRPFFLSPFDAKIEAHTRPDPLARACHAGVTQLSVAPDGTLFPCVQFLEHADYAIGHVSDGIDDAQVAALFGDTHTDNDDSCGDCAIRSRCGRDCTCVRFQSSGDTTTLSATVCAHERLLTPIADAAARALYRDRVPHFVQRHYNPAYPPLRAIEALLGDR